MQRPEYHAFFEAEIDHWWFRSRLAIVLDAVRRAELDGPVLDLGCGAGPFLEALSPEHEVMGMDVAPEGLRICRQRGHRNLVRAVATHIPFRTGSLGGVLVLDVLEHVRSDGAAVRECVRALRPGGGAVFTVPAHRIFFGPHDVAVHHVRRYARSEFVRRLRESFGAPPEREGFFFGLPFPMTLVFRVVERIFGSRRPKASDVTLRLPGPFNRLLESVMRLERRLLRRRMMPIGSSLMAVARTPRR